MNAEVFVDTNILLYTIDEDPASASKRQRAQQLLLSEPLGLVDPGRGGVLRQRHLAQTSIPTRQR